MIALRQMEVKKTKRASMVSIVAVEGKEKKKRSSVSAAASQKRVAAKQFLFLFK